MRRLPMFVRWLSAIVVAFLAPALAHGETPGVHPFALVPGDRVRLWTTAEPGRLVAASAFVSAADHAGMMVVVGDEARLVPFDDVARLEVRRGRSWAKRGAIAGFALGVLTGAYLLADEIRGRDADAEDRVRQGALLGALGAGLGALTGGVLHPARWEPVSVSLARPRGAAVSVSFRF